MADDIDQKTAETAKLYFNGVPGERPFELWKAFDKSLAKEFSRFITGRLYARQVLPHTTRQLVTTAALTALGKLDELKLHLHAGRNVGVPAKELAEAIFQTGVYAGVPAMNGGLSTLREVLQERGEWPIDNG